MHGAKKVKILICLDGCGPRYLDCAHTPNIDAIVSSGFKNIGEAAIPTVTNVNNTTIVTASFPESHGITSNYYLDPSTGREFYMESSEFILKETIFRKAADKGLKSALLTGKDKLKTLIGDGTTEAESAENPPPWLVQKLGPPPGIYDVEVNHWLFKAAIEMLRVHPPDLLYITTTDYAMHAHSPEDEKSQWNIHQLDRLLGELLNSVADFEIIITADHGMNAKNSALDLNRLLNENGIRANAIPIIKDRYVVHHQNMGGAAYVYLEDSSSLHDAAALLRQQDGIESVMSGPDASKLYRLHPDRIGHIFVLADAATVFGSLTTVREEVSIRSHGSLHEREIPILGCGAGPLSILPKSNVDVASWIV
jgi:phosphonoacetate hydrolase